MASMRQLARTIKYLKSLRQHDLRSHGVLWEVRLEADGIMHLMDKPDLLLGIECISRGEWIDGQWCRHNLDGPATVSFDGTVKEYYISGTQISEEAFVRGYTKLGMILYG